MVSQPDGHQGSPRAWVVLQILLGAEAIGLMALVAFTIVSSMAEAGAFTQEMSLVLMSAALCAWVALTCIGVVKSRASWARASAVTIHVLMFAAGTGCLQLGIGPWWLGWGIVVLALAGFIAAIIARPTLAHTDIEAETL